VRLSFSPSSTSGTADVGGGGPGVPPPPGGWGPGVPTGGGALAGAITTATVLDVEAPSASVTVTVSP
jgi:hypothetical protein